MAPLSEEEENYIRLALLLKGVTPRAVRSYFDREFRPTSLTSTLNTSQNTLFELKLKRIINQAQWNLLIPRNGVADSKTFDVTLMICLIRNLTLINPPINGFDSLPLPGETTEGPDLARIKCYRNILAHHDSNTIDTVYFNTAWGDISDAVGRLGGQTMYQECQELKVKILDQSNQEIILEIKNSVEEMKELKLTTDSLVMEQSKMKDTLKELQTSHITLQTKHSQVTENLTQLKDSHSTLQTEHATVMEIIKDPIPLNIKDQIKKQIENWEQKDKMFVSTRASDYVLERLQDNSCLTLTAPSGVGKSFIARHTALVLKKHGYNIIPVELPADIRTYYQPGKQAVFIVDDICGNFTANQQQIDTWKQLLPVIYTIIADKCCKIIVSCRLQVFKDERFNILSPFKSCECNLISNKLSLTCVEKTTIAKTYIGTSMLSIDDLSPGCDCFPLLCSLYHEKEDANIDVKEFFKNPFGFYKSELDSLCEHGDDGNYKICSLALCVLFNNQLNERWFQGKVTDEQQQIIKDTCEACEVNSIPKLKLKKALDTLEGTFICKQNGIYRTVHDKLFDFIAYYFGQKMIECLIDHGGSGLVHERLIWRKSPDDKNGYIDFIIEISDEYLHSYLKRLIKDWSNGNVTDVFSNINFKVTSFRHQLIQYLLLLDKQQLVTLVNTKDTVVPKMNCSSGTTPLVEACCYGYTDMVQWMLENGVDVDQLTDSGVNGLLITSYKGHTDTVKLLLEKDPLVDLCDKDGCSPLYLASQQGHTDIVKLLLERNPNVDVCDNNGCSPLYRASQNGRSDVVKLLLEMNPQVDLCDKDGRSALYWASWEGHTDMVRLLLEKNPNVDLCDKDGFTPLIRSCWNNHTSIVQLLVKQKPNINAKTYDGGNALYIGTWNGNIEITKLLLENNADCNICIHSKQYITETLTNHPLRTLEKQKQASFDFLTKQSLSFVADYIREKSVDYAFDVEAGFSSLHLACFMGRIDVVHCLLDHKANINITKEDGTTPLFFACEVGHKDIVRLLLDRGADTQICRLDGKSPLNMATENGHTSIVMTITNCKKEEDKSNS